MKAQPLEAIASAYDDSSLFGRYAHLWVWRFLWKHLNRGSELKPEDLHSSPKSCNSALLGEKLELYWDKHVKRCKASGKQPYLFWPVLRMWGPFYIGFVSLLCIIGYGFQIVQGVWMGSLIESVNRYKNESISQEERQVTLQDVYLYGSGIILSQLIYVAFINPFFFQASKVGMEIRVACCSLIYRKALRLSKTAFLKTSAGNIVNLLSNDTSRFDFCVLHTPFFLYGPISVFATVIILWPYLGYITLYGIMLLILYIPLQTYMGNLFSKFRAGSAQLSDERVRLMNEFIPAMRVIKMYAWEEPFSKMIGRVRKAEIAKIKGSSFLRAINISLFYVSAKIIIFVILSIWVLGYKNFLDAKMVFLTFSLMNHIRVSVCLMLPNAVSFGSEALISLKRITTYLCLPEIQQSEKLNRSNFVVNGIDIELNIENLSASYGDATTKHLLTNGNLNGNLNGTAKSNGKANGKANETKKSVEFADVEGPKFDQNVLTNINLNCKPGELIVVVGPVGSGKSSILLSVLGELFINKGRIDVKGRVSYSSQEAWTFGGTVRENILFNGIYDPEKYREVVRVCGLERDLTLLPQGDQTIISDRGSLSGGQRARVNLARALYYDCDIYLLDDPLSAVDAHVSKHIFSEAIRGYLAKKAVILVTHQLQFVKSAHKILLIKNGQQIAYGDYNSLLSSLNNKMEFREFIGVNVEQNKPKESKPIENYRVSVSSETSLYNPAGGSMLSLSSSVQLEPEKEVLSKEEYHGERAVKQESENLAGSWKAYGVYIKLGSGWLVGPGLIVVFILAQTFFSGSDWWLSLFTDSEQRKKLAFEQNPNASLVLNETFVDRLSPMENVATYSILMGLLFLLSLGRGIIFFVLCMRASVRLHSRIFRSICRTSMSFFERTPIGNVLNRFSRDVGIIDDLIPLTAFDAFGIIATDIGIAVMLLSINPWTIVSIFALMALILSIRYVYISCARRIKICEGLLKSFVFTILSTSLDGLTSIRAFKKQKQFEKRFDAHQNDHSSAWFFYIATGRWLLFYMDLSSIVFIGGVTGAMLLMIDNFNSATVGLMISSSLMFSGGFQWCMRQWTELETQMTSVDRVNEYSQLEPEGDLESPPDKRPPVDWPSQGNIEFRNLSMSYYKDEQPVLNNLNFRIQAGEKIGIVGRTGAGKSSIITALFRLTPYEGDIVIDGINCKEIGLHELRKKIAIIPQDPVLFTGTIRSNLDPFDEHDDDKLWKVLEEVQLKRKVEEGGLGLYGPITDSGSNFSVGQKQLICLARAILRSNRILILDEATANVDPASDALIQKTIRNVFDCTVLSIAHRLNTVMDASKVLVMDAGCVQEFDTVPNLLANKESSFNAMINATGGEMARTLRKIAKEIELLKSASSLHPELSEKIQESIGSAKTEKAEPDEFDYSMDDDASQTTGEDSEAERNKDESTHF